MPTGGEYAIGLGAVADEDPCVTFRRGINERTKTILVDNPMMSGFAAQENAAVDEFRVWLERHNTELRRRDERDQVDRTYRAQMANETARAQDRVIDDLKARIAKALEQHERISEGVNEGFCTSCEGSWPCDTYRALSGEDQQ